jgi:NAD-dependent SIR2 family protein deacetylase
MRHRILDDALRRSAEAISNAGSLLFTAGAGMGVDSGLPDFRGPEGFWRAYPAFAKLGIQFEEAANPAWFRRDPALAWGFYGHRLELYRRAAPHGGFGILARWEERAPSGAFVFTSNVDGHFQLAGFPEDGVMECHGSIHFLQCVEECQQGIFPAGPFRVEVDAETGQAREPFPSCPACGGLARPNVLMFGDWGWISTRTDAQEVRLDVWREGAKGPLVVVECGAGLGVPTVRLFGERAASLNRGTLIRINPRDADGGPDVRTIRIRASALDTLSEIDAQIG